MSSAVSPKRSLFESFSGTPLRQSAETEAEPSPIKPSGVCESIVSIDTGNPRIKHEIVRIICGWLEENGFMASLHTLREEAGLLRRDEYTRRKATKAASKGIEEGNWEHVSQQVSRLTPEHRYRGVAFLAAKQQFLEIVDAGDGSKAYNFFMKRIKPLERSVSRHEFDSLLYLLTAKSVAEGASFSSYYRDWSVDSGRRQLVDELRRASGHADDSGLEAEVYFHRHGVQPVPNQLSRLLHHGFSYQLMTSSGATVPTHLKGATPIPIQSVVDDAFEHFPPIHQTKVLQTNEKVKAIFPFPTKDCVAVGSADGLVSIWTLTEPAVRSVLGHHQGRVWALAGVDADDSDTLVSCAADGVVMMWDVAKKSSTGVFSVNEGDVFCVDIAPSRTAIACGAFNGEVSVWDVATKERLRLHRFATSAVVSLCFSRHGRTLYTGSKDGCIRLIDVASGVLTQTLSPPLAAEISAIALSPSSCYLAVAYKNNTNRIWDILRGEMIPTRLTGHVNIDKSFIRCAFGPQDFLFTASEDGNVVMWEVQRGAGSSAELVKSNSHTLPLHRSMVTDIQLSLTHSMMFSSSDDGRVVVCTSRMALRKELES